jgi:Thaumatin family
MAFGTQNSSLNYYDVSLVDGFNIPVSMSPIGGGRGCGVAGCEVDLNVCCPSRFEVKSRYGMVVGCKSACLALRTDKYCCTSLYGSLTSANQHFSLSYSSQFALALIVMHLMNKLVSTCARLLDI